MIVAEGPVVGLWGCWESIDATPRHATPRHATPRHATPRHALVLCLGGGVFLAACDDEFAPDAPSALNKRVNWGDVIRPSEIIELEGVGVADMVDVDAATRFQVLGFQEGDDLDSDSNADDEVGQYVFLTVDLVDDDDTPLPTIASTSRFEVAFPVGQRAMATAKLSVLDGAVSGGTVVWVGGDFNDEVSPQGDPQIRYKVGTASLSTPSTLDGDSDAGTYLEEGEVLRAVARHGLDGFMAVGDDGLIVRTRPDPETGHHDLTTWYIERPPWMAEDDEDAAPDLNDVIKLGTGNLIVGDGGEVWLWRPVPVGYTSASTWGIDAEWRKLDLDTSVDLTAAAADHVQEVVMPEPPENESDWTTAYVDKVAYALVVGEGGYLARFGVNLVERDLKSDAVADDPTACDSPSCEGEVPDDLVTVDATELWDDADLNDVWSDDRTRIVVGDGGNLWTFPKSAALSAANEALWWDRGPPAEGGLEVDFMGVASDHSVYLAVGMRDVLPIDTSQPITTEGVAFLGVTRVKGCTLVGDFRRSCSPDQEVPAPETDPPDSDTDTPETDLPPSPSMVSCVADFDPQVSFSITDCLVDLEIDSEAEVNLSSARMAMHAAGGSTEVYATSLVEDGSTANLFHLTFPSAAMNANTLAPFFIVNLEVTDPHTDAPVIERDQFELLVIPTFPPGGPGPEEWPETLPSFVDPVATHGGYDYESYSEGFECFPNWEQSVTSVAGEYVDLVYGRRNPTIEARGEPQSIERLTGGARVIPSALWVELLAGRDISNTSRQQHQNDAETDRCSPWAALSETPYADLDALVGGFSRFRNTRTHGYPDDYERELGGGEFAYASLKHDFFGRCSHLELPGEPWPDVGFEAACCEEVESVMVPKTVPIDVYAPFRARVMLIAAPNAPSPCNGAEALRDRDPPEFDNLNGDMVSEIDPDPCPIKDLSEVVYGSSEGAYISRLLGRTLLVWWPDPEEEPYDAGWEGSVVMAIDNVDMCVPFNEDAETPTVSIVEAGDRIGVFSNHTSMDVAVWVNDQHDRWRYVSYFDMLPDNLYQIYVTKFGFKPRYSAGTEPQFDPIITAAERYYECPAVPFLSEVSSPSDPDDASLSLACQVPSGTQLFSVFTQDSAPLQPGRVWCPTRTCRVAGTGGFPRCLSPAPFACSDAVLGGCTPTGSGGLACHGDFCTEVACPRDRFLSNALR